MTHYSLNIEKVTPEIREALKHLQTLAGVTIVPGNSTKEKTRNAWDTAIAEGAVSVDVFFDELNVRIEKWLDRA